MVINSEGLVETTLGYLEHEGCYLMMHRVKKAEDLNKGKWIGVGGHLEEGETPEQCMIRETLEETGIRLKSVRCRGIVDFLNDKYDPERMYLFTSEEFCREGGEEAGSDEDSPAEIPFPEAPECNEGILRWVPKDEVLSLNIWEGDRVFLKLLAEGAPFFHIALHYHGDELVRVEQLQR